MSFSRQEGVLTGGRQNQKQRTREALLDAAASLARAGRSPSIAEVAEAARVSTATAYRYFPNPQSLWADLGAWQGPKLTEMLDDLPEDVESRVDLAVRRAAAVQFADEALWRAVLRATLDRWFDQVDLPDDDRVPIRGSVRMDATRTVLGPLAATLPPEQLDRLTKAVVLVYGVEAMIVSRDAFGLEEAQAADLMSWAARSLVRAALAEADRAAPGV